MEDFEQTITQTAESMRNDGDWLLRNQNEQIVAHEQRLQRAETMVRRLLEVIMAERQRFSAYRPQPQQQLPQNNNKVADLRQAKG